MISIVRQLYAIIRPSGRRELAGALCVVVFQALLQTIAVFSLAPFLSAAVDIAHFRGSAVGRIFEYAFGNGTDRRLLLSAALVSLFLLIAGNLFSLFAEVARSRYAQAVGRRLRKEMLEALLERKYQYFLGVNSSSLTKNLVEDVSNVAVMILMPMLEIISRILLVILLALGCIFFEPVIIAFGVLIIVLYYIIVMRPIRSTAMRASDVIKENVRKLYFEVQQILGAIKPIFASDQREYFIQRVEKASAELSQEVAVLPIYASLPRSGLEIAMFGSMIGWIVMLLLTGNDLTSAIPRIGLIAIVAYRLMPSIQLIFANMGSLSAAKQSLEEVSELLQEQAELTAGAPRLGSRTFEPLHWQQEIRFQDITFSYPGADAPALAGVSFAIRKGSRVAFVGPTGSGKSTLIDILLGLLEPQGGTILVDGRPLGPAEMPNWRRSIGYVPQELFLLDGTIAENIAFGHAASGLDRKRVLEVADVAQATDFIAARAGRGIDEFVGERGVKLSGGQRQRLALARALYPDPDMLVMDEATSALDPVTEKLLTEALAKGSAKLTTVTVAHRMSTVRNYDVIHFVEHGRLAFSGTYDELISSEPRFRDFVSHASQ